MMVREEMVSLHDMIFAQMYELYDPCTLMFFYR